GLCPGYALQSEGRVNSRHPAGDSLHSGWQPSIALLAKRPEILQISLTENKPYVTMGIRGARAQSNS
ncbi:MAG TPA: hypothetical protein VIU43_04885, partial [Nitrosospira sp.]